MEWKGLLAHLGQASPVPSEGFKCQHLVILPWQHQVGSRVGWLPRAQLVSDLGARTPHVLTWVGEEAEVHRMAFPRLRVGATSESRTCFPLAHLGPA